MRLAPIALALCLAALPARGEDYGPPCPTATSALAVVQTNGVPAARLDGDDAVAMTDAINRTGEPTSYAAFTLVLVLLPDRVVVGLFNARHEADVTLSPEGFRQAYERMRGGRA